jgi:hypothetical protein
MFAFRYATNGFSHCPIGQKHKFFDEFIGVFRFLKINAKRFAIFVEIEFYFVSVEIDCAIGKTSCTKYFG